MTRKTIIFGLILVLIFAATSTGIFYRTHEPRVEHVTVRGDDAIFQGSGLYRYDPATLAREAIIWDVINLVIGLPLLALGIYLGGRDSLRGRMLLSGLMSYFFYVYLMYATMMAFNPLFLVYVLIFGLCAIAFVINLSVIDIASLPTQIGERFPRRLYAGYMLVVAVMMTFLWLGRVIPITLTNSLPTELAGFSTLEAQALDLGFIVPLNLVAAILLRRGSPWGYILAGIGSTHGLMMFLSIPTWIIVPLVEGGEFNPIESIPFLVMSVSGILLAVRFYQSIQAEAA